MLGDISLSNCYIYGDSSVAGQKNVLIYGVNLNSTQKLGYGYDDLSRLQSKTVGTETPFVTEYTYLEGKDSNTTTTLVKTVNGVITDYYWLNGMLQGQKTGEESILFRYDENGNAYGFITKNGTGENT